MNASLNRIILFGKDIVSLKQFYQENFSFELSEEILGEWVVLKAGATEIAFHKIGESYLNNKPFRAESNTKMVFTIDTDLVEFREKLLAKGILLHGIRSFEPRSLSCDGEDPEGNIFQLIQRNAG